MRVGKERLARRTKARKVDFRRLEYFESERLGERRSPLSSWSASKSAVKLVGKELEEVADGDGKGVA